MTQRKSTVALLLITLIFSSFPLHAQQAYRAMAREAGRAETNQRPAVYRQPTNDSPPAKFGLLRRLAEVARGRRDERILPPVNSAVEAGERVDLPVFFGRGKPS